MWIISLLLLASCALNAPSPVGSHAAYPIVTIVDRAGLLIEGARVDWQQGGPWACDMAASIQAAYVRTGHALTGPEGKIVVPDGAVTLRAIAPNGDAVMARVDHDTTLVVIAPSVITLEPRRGNQVCGAFTGHGTISSRGVRCPIVVDATAGPLVVRSVVSGELDLEVRSQQGTEDERAMHVHAEITGDTTLTPALPQIAGAGTLHGRVLIEGRPPGGPDYASAVRVRCADLLERHATPDALTGSFTIRNLPAGVCTLHASSDVREQTWQRDLPVHAGTEVTVELAAQTR